ncbi:hypothetical protein BBD42_02125 [Paenibacillus sp. BIHB 4019]|uniref:Knr4/Smi1-like domain-containing protein n=1 Tax=Paenibacillus sp. BIHB 4019 TaxID=1870819 RepID=A0A1B2DCF3_9BACL|nr:SMI1/KNR4 family protein [Paenibacillus sp. BIHB 4019]ANY65400.1 hypothetical protein BBD42_02125 [Paenibacillus sp. BIHB 4019]
MVTWTTGYDKADIENVKIVEEKLAIHFPQDYLNYAVKYQGGRPSPSNIRVDGKGSVQFISLLTFLAFDELDILDKYNSVKKHFPTGLVPFGLGADEHLFCFDYRAGSTPSVLLCKSYSDIRIEVMHIWNSFSDLIYKFC